MASRAALSAHLQHGKQLLEELPKVAKHSERVTVLLGMNPAAYSLQGTNCYLIGQGQERLLLDTGEGRPEFVQNLLPVLRREACKITGVVLTHSHVDHIGGLPALLQRFPDLEIWRCRPPSQGLTFGRLGTPEDATDPAVTLSMCSGAKVKLLQDGDVISVAGATLKAVHTPGHAVDHLCFWLEEEQALFTGDHILGTGTVIVDDLEAYMSSLQRLHDLRPQRIYPGHGPMLQGSTAQNRPQEYIQHRQQRLKKTLELLESSPRSLAELLREVYGSALPADAFLQHAARRNLEASLEKLEKDGHATRRFGGTWTISQPGGYSGYSSSLRQLLQCARPKWSAKDVAAAEAKLHAIHISDAKMLADQLQSEALNENLRSAGFRVFTAETLEALAEQAAVIEPPLEQKQSIEV
eukprot:Skav200862  [mRNA]  locus=scaffold71:30715:31944:+ [translate_table: standard]